MRSRLARLPLTPVFGVVSLLAILAVAVMLHGYLKHLIEERAIATAVRSSQFVARVSLDPILAPGIARGSLTEQQLENVDAALANGLAEGMVARMKIFDPSGRVIYSDDHAIIGQRYDVAVIKQVLAGQPHYEMADTAHEDHHGERGLGPLMEVFVPLHNPANGTIVGVAELYVPFDPIERGIATDVQHLVGILIGGLLLLWVVLLGVVVLASRRLRQQLARNAHQALHDALTGLPNRTLLFDRIDRAVAAAERRDSSVAVLLLDLDRFKDVNDTLGHHTGDRLLIEVASRFADVLSPADTLARLGGDEFAVLLPDTEDQDAEEVARRLVEALDSPVDIDGLTVSVGASVGIATAPFDGDSPALLLQRADVAMYVAKQSHSPVVYYTTEIDQYSPERLSLLGEMRTALETGQLKPYFQPKADARTGRVTGMEALLRWEHPQRGIIPPGEFIPLVEHTGLIDTLTPYVVGHALEQSALWSTAGHDLRVSVNVSVRNIVDATFPDRIASLLADSMVSPQSLVLEITESALMTDPDTALLVIRQLKRLGVALSIDDYGSGYSSLAYLQHLPVDELKIDRQFVTNLAERPTDRAIVRSTIELGQNLGLVVVAEGVEDQATWDTLVELDCDQVQGYHIGYPLPPQSILSWLAACPPAGVEQARPLEVRPSRS